MGIARATVTYRSYVEALHKSSHKNQQTIQSIGSSNYSSETKNAVTQVVQK
jgi:hypothetical protein